MRLSWPMTSLILGTLLFGATITFAAGNWSDAKRAGDSFSTEHQALTKLTPAEAESLVTAVCAADEDERQSVGAAASKRVQTKIDTEYTDLEKLFDATNRKLDDVLADTTLAGDHEAARKLKRDIATRMKSIDKMTRSLRGANHPVVRYMVEQGQNAHKRRQDSSMYCTVSEFTIGNGRADCIYAPSCTVIELKPDNDKAIGKGRKQVETYTNELNGDATLRAELVKRDKRFGECESFEPRVDCYLLCPSIDPGTADYQSVAVSWRKGC
jgi:hypothetical protein